MNRESIEASKIFLSNSLDYIDTKEVLRYYLALNHHYQIDQNQMPIPIWRRKGFTDQGTAAWNELRQINMNISPERGMSIYIHVPLCPSRCSFCDCLTSVVDKKVTDVLDNYLESLIKEISAWKNCGNLSDRPVTTIHLGGGTPLFLGYERFKLLVGALRSSFKISTQTEWALETTSSSLSPSILEGLTKLGFRRLHLGVQSMEEHVRPLLKRRETSNIVLEKIKAVLQMGWIVSVDLLIGLPLETLDGILNGIDQLINAGVDGFSIYEINISTQNMAFAEQYHLLDRDRRENYLIFVATVMYLLQKGYQKNLFNHFANNRDQNLYFTFPMRSEDCLALGAYADGVFKDYHYRHHDLQKTIETTSDCQPAIQGGIRRPPKTQKLFPIEISILSGKFTKNHFESILSVEQTCDLISDWKAALLIEETHPEIYSLTPNGAWFSGNMIQDLHRIAVKHV